MAGQPRAFVLLLGMGLRSFSMSPAFIPSIKELASHLDCQQAEQILQHALRLKNDHPRETLHGRTAAQRSLPTCS